MNNYKMLRRGVTLLRANLQRLATLEYGALVISRLKDKTKIQLQQGGSDISEQQEEAGIYDSISEFLDILAEPQLAELFGIPTSRQDENSFRCLLNVGRDTLSFIVKRSDYRLMLSDVVSYNRNALIEALPLSQLRKVQISNFAIRVQGITLIAAAQEQLATAFWSAISLALPNNDLRDTPQEASIVVMQATDPLSPLFMLKERVAHLKDLTVNASVALAFLDKNCAACARVSRPDQRLLKGLPYPISDDYFKNYQIGRGCARCNEKGYAGVVCLTGIIDKGITEILTKIEDGAKDTEILKLVYDHGAKALFEDGLEKIKEGVLSLESLLKVVNTVPEAYLKLHESYKQEEQSKPIFQAKREKPLLLVAEDDPDQASILELVLSTAGYDIEMTKNGREALSVAKAKLPDLILTDLMMPEMDGSALVKAVREDHALGKIPIMILTVSTDKEKEFQLLDIGADDYCEKTVQRKILLKRVERLLSRGQ